MTFMTVLEDHSCIYELLAFDGQAIGIRQPLPVDQLFLETDFGPLKMVELEAESVRWRYPLSSRAPDASPWDGGAAMSRAFTHFFHAAPRKQVATRKERQLFNLDMYDGLDRAQNAWPINVTLFPVMTNWLAGKTGNRLPEVERDMHQVWTQVGGKPAQQALNEFRVFVEEGMVQIVLPFRSGLAPNPSAQSRPSGCGYELYSNNLDTPLHQLTLLAGLARLHQLARDEGV